MRMADARSVTARHAAATIGSISSGRTLLKI
jgi:hypothetical protein